MLWKFEGSMPVYKQIMDQMRRAVLLGEFPPGSRVPAVRDLAAEANVNPNTMQRALMTLESEEILVSRGTIGRFVTEDQQILEKLRASVMDQVVRSCAQQFRAMGLDMQQASQLLLTLEEEESEWKTH